MALHADIFPRPTLRTICISHPAANQITLKSNFTAEIQKDFQGPRPMGIDFITIETGRSDLKFWDMAGQDRFRSLLIPPETKIILIVAFSVDHFGEVYEKIPEVKRQQAAIFAVCNDEYNAVDVNNRYPNAVIAKIPETSSKADFCNLIDNNLEAILAKNAGHDIAPAAHVVQRHGCVLL